MGILDIFKKSKGNDESGAANNNQGFSLVVEDSFQLMQNKGIVVAGFLHGEIKVGDKAYVTHPDKRVTETQIAGIEIGAGKQAERADNQHVALWFETIKQKEDVQVSSVVTGNKP